MKERKIKVFCIIFLLVLCFCFSSCRMPENILQGSSEVDFTTPQRVQISFNDHIYDTVIIYDGYKAEIKFINNNDLMKGAHIFVSSTEYKISYNEMIFQGEIQALSTASLPSVVYTFLSSFENGVILESFDKEKNCYYTKRVINDYFVVLEAYEKEKETTIYSIEIK